VKNKNTNFNTFGLNVQTLINLFLARYRYQINDIGSVMVSMLSSSAVDRGSESCAGKTKDVFAVSPLSANF
jgi:hypothetical protein